MHAISFYQNEWNRLFFLFLLFTFCFRFLISSFLCSNSDFALTTLSIGRLDSTIALIKIFGGTSLLVVGCVDAVLSANI